MAEGISETADIFRRAKSLAFIDNPPEDFGEISASIGSPKYACQANKIDFHFLCKGHEFHVIWETKNRLSFRRVRLSRKAAMEDREREMGKEKPAEKN